MQRLGVDFAIDHEFAKLSKFGGIDVYECKDGFLQILPRAKVVVVVGNHVSCSRSWIRSGRGSRSWSGRGRAAGASARGHRATAATGERESNGDHCQNQKQLVKK